MRALIAVLAALLLILLPTNAWGEEEDTCPDGKVCIEEKDWKTVATVLREKQCLMKTDPKVTADPLTIVVDRQGRIYGSGSNPQPFTMRLSWCNYDITAEGQTKIVAAQYVEPDWGFRFRPKATVGILWTELLVGEKFTNAVDGGALIEPFYYHFVNLNAYVGVRSLGAGVGFDLTKNFGVNLGYAITWNGWRSNPFASAYFAFW